MIGTERAWLVGAFDLNSHVSLPRIGTHRYRPSVSNPAAGSDSARSHPVMQGVANIREGVAKVDIVEGGPAPSHEFHLAIECAAR